MYYVNFIYPSSEHTRQIVYQNNFLSVLIWHQNRILKQLEKLFTKHNTNKLLVGRNLF